MLGLSGGITSVSAPGSRVLLETYTADWSSDTDGWASYAGNDEVATLTHGITFEGKSNALRVQFNANPAETPLCGLQRPNPFSTAVQPGDLIVLTYDIRLDSAWDSTGDGSDDLTDLWDGVDIVGTMVQMTGAITDFSSLAQDTWVSVDTSTITNDATQGDDLIRDTGNTHTYILFNNVNDAPQYKARFYLHNLVAKLYRSQIFT